jgi:hypothetical protein
VSETPTTSPFEEGSEVTAFAILRAGLDLNPEFRPVIRLLLATGVLLSLGRIAIPVLFQRLIDGDLLEAAGYSRSELLTLAVITTAVVVGVVLPATSRP